MTIPLSTRIQCCQLRQSTFRKSGCLTTTEKQFADSGFIKTGNLVECVHCGANANVDLTMYWTRKDIARLHRTGCIFSLSDLDYVLRRAIFIRARRSRGLRSLCDNTVLSLIWMGFSNEEIQKATTEFFLDYGAFPDTNDLLEYILH